MRFLADMGVSTRVTHSDPAVVANAVICLIHQANYLLDREIGAIERAFVEGGGYSEQLASARILVRSFSPYPAPCYNPSRCWSGGLWRLGSRTVCRAVCP